jgi:hypothetical protein
MPILSGYRTGWKEPRFERRCLRAQNSTIFSVTYAEQAGTGPVIWPVTRRKAAVFLGFWAQKQASPVDSPV